MITRQQPKHKYAYSCLLSSSAGLLGLINPFLVSLLVAKAKENFNILNLLPVIACLAAVTASRIYFRIVISKLLGGSQRAPFIWLQRRIGGWLWWLEPLLHNWGWVGMVVTKFSGTNPVSSQVASGLIYILSDALISFFSGVIYYFTESYILSFLSVLILPTLIVIPWITKKTAKINDFNESRHTYKIKKDQIR